MRHKSRIILCLGLGILWGALVSAASQDASGAPWAKAVLEYQSGRYAASAKIFEDIRRSGFESPGLYYNLGNAYFRSGETGEAIWAYERALRLDPRSEDTRWNLSIAEKTLTERPDVTPSAPDALGWIVHYLRYLSSDEIALALAVSVGLFALGVIGKRVLPPAKSFFGKLAGLSMVLVLLTGSMTAIRWNEIRTPLALIRSAEAVVRYGPASSNTSAFVLHEGARVRIEKESGGWVFVRFGARQSGWLPAENILKV
ncbi:MAG: tetratricopeptide repeat protein [Candidatus Omnitrophica bacterium]|nr:tetratricopeptide repeat protein [Candidatus Omnitrophota bacterium]